MVVDVQRVPLCPICLEQTVLAYNKRDQWRSCNTCKYDWPVKSFFVLQDLAGDATKWRSMTEEPDTRQLILFS